MRTGRSLEELSRELLRVRENKRDFLADTRRVMLDSSGGSPALMLAGVPHAFGLTRLATTQLAEHTGVPMRFFDRLAKDYPIQLASTVNAILEKEPATRMVRTLDGKARAWLSNSYRTLDNDIAADAVLPVLMGRGARIESCELTETKLYIKAVFTDRETAVDVGDFVQAGVVFSNSEVGGGAFSLSPFIYRLACKNGAIRNDNTLRAIHLGGKEGESEVREYFQSDTRRALDQAFMLKVRDTIELMASPDFLERLVQPMREALADPITKTISDVMELTAKRYGLGETEREGVLMQLASGGSMTRFGLLNAVTRYSQDVTDYDRATELERIGGQIIEMPKREWNTLAIAA